MNPKENITKTEIAEGGSRHALPKSKPRLYRSSSSGQMFLIAAIFMIIGIVLLKNLLSLPIITQEKTFQDTSILDRGLKNIKGEFAYAASVASMQPQPNSTGVEYLRNFSTSIRRDFNSKILYVYIFSNGTTGNFSATVGNFLQNNITGAINFTGLAGGQIDLNDTQNVTMEFNTTGWINTTLNYTIQNSQIVERFSFNSSARNYIAAFFDISLTDSGLYVRSKSIYNRSW